MAFVKNNGNIRDAESNELSKTLIDYAMQKVLRGSGVPCKS
jgi:hypothetical protein